MHKTNRVYVGARLPDGREADKTSETVVMVIQTFDDRGQLTAEPPRYLDHVCRHDSIRARAFVSKYGCHSPSGFNWGYGGSGPAELALMILIDLGLTDQQAWDLHQPFKSAVIAQLTSDTWSLDERQLWLWLDHTAVGRQLRHRKARSDKPTDQLSDAQEEAREREILQDVETPQDY